MRLRSLLFVPGDSEKKFAKASQSGADALILDLEDAVAPGRKSEARETTRSLIANEPRDWRCLVRINPLGTGLTLEDLASVVKPGLDGVVVPKANGPDDINKISDYLDAFETKVGIRLGNTKVIVVATETPAAMFALSSYSRASDRLVALTWGAEDLAAAIGASSNKTEDGSWTQPYQAARSQCLFAAANAEVAAIDTLYANFRDRDGLVKDCANSRRDGFVGRIAIHPDQVGPINQSFTPSAEEIEKAQRIVDAFAANPDAGAIGLDGQMYDIPHLKAAQRTLGES